MTPTDYRTAQLALIKANQSTAIPAAAAPSYVSATMYTPPVLTQKISENLTKNSEIQRAQFPSDRPKYYCQIDVADYTRANGGDLINLPKLNFTDSIVLPMPSQLVDNHRVNYQEEAIGTMLGAVTNSAAPDVTNKNNSGGMSGDLSTMEGMHPGAAGPTPPAATPSTGNNPIASAAKGLTQGALATAAGLSPVAKAFTGYSPNQFLTILLKGPTYKQFQMQWVLSPRNPDEAEQIKKMAFLLKKKMSPGISSGLGAAVFTFPSLFQISLHPNSEYLYKFKPSVLAGFATNYSKDGVAFYRQGAKSTSGEELNAPETVVFEMWFMEMEYWLAECWRDNNDPLDTKALR